MDKDLKGLATIHYSELPEGQLDSPTHLEWQTFRRELPRLLAEGHEGTWALIKGDKIIDLFTTLDEGYLAGRTRYLFQPFLVQPVREWQPLLRMRPYY